MMVDTAKKVNLQRWSELNQISILITGMQDSSQIQDLEPLLADMNKKHSRVQILEMLQAMLVKTAAGK